MALIVKGSVGIVIDTAGHAFPTVTSSTIAVGDILQRDTANSGLERATSSSAPADANTGLFAVAVGVAVAADTEVLAVPLIYGMLLEADLNANSSSAHNMQRMKLTDHDTLDNSGTDITANEGVFLQIAPIGAAANKRALVMYVGGPNQLSDS